MGSRRLAGAAALLLLLASTGCSAPGAAILGPGGYPDEGTPWTLDIDDNCDLISDEELADAAAPLMDYIGYGYTLKPLELSEEESDQGTRSCRADIEGSHWDAGGGTLVIYGASDIPVISPTLSPPGSDPSQIEFEAAGLDCVADAGDMQAHTWVSGCGSNPTMYLLFKFEVHGLSVPYDQGHIPPEVQGDFIIEVTKLVTSNGAKYAEEA